MICLNCKKDMIVVEHQQIELDYCPACEGVWFDSGELDLLLQKARLESPDKLIDEILASPPVKVHKERKCPICGKGMQERATGEPAINIDICRQGDGIWFDGGEMQQLLTQLAQKCRKGENSEQEIVCFLGDVFQAKK